jgi:hypothetical protein
MRIDRPFAQRIASPYEFTGVDLKVTRGRYFVCTRIADLWCYGHFPGAFFFFNVADTVDLRYDCGILDEFCFKEFFDTRQTTGDIFTFADLFWDTGDEGSRVDRIAVLDKEVSSGWDGKDFFAFFAFVSDLDLRMVVTYPILNDDELLASGPFVHPVLLEGYAGDDVNEFNAATDR